MPEARYQPPASHHGEPMNEQQKALVKATVPVLKTNGVALTKHFYQRMFTHNPELKNIFNQRNLN